MSELILTIENKKIVIEGVNENNVSMYVHQLLSENNTLLQQEFYKHNCVPCSDFKTHLIECFKHSMKHERNDNRVLDAIEIEFKYYRNSTSFSLEKNRFNLCLTEKTELIEVEESKLTEFCKKGISKLDDDEYGTFVNQNDPYNLYISFPSEYRFLSKIKLYDVCMRALEYPPRLQTVEGGTEIIGKLDVIYPYLCNERLVNETGKVIVNIVKKGEIIAYLLNGNKEDLIAQHPEHRELADVVLEIYKTGKSVDELANIKVNDKLYMLFRRGGISTEINYYIESNTSRRFD